MPNLSFSIYWPLNSCGNEFCWSKTPNGSIVSGSEGLLLNSLRDRFGMQYTMKTCTGEPDKLYEYVYDMCLDDVKNDPSGISLGYWWMTYDRYEEGVTFSTTTLKYLNTLNIKNATEISYANTALIPFDTSLWIILIIFCTINGCIYFYLEQNLNTAEFPPYNPQVDNWYVFQGKHLTHMCYKGIMSAFRGGPIGVPVTNVGRTIVLGSSLFSIMISTLYMAKLIAYLNTKITVFNKTDRETINSMGGLSNMCVLNMFGNTAQQWVNNYPNIQVVPIDVYFKDASEYTQLINNCYVWIISNTTNIDLFQKKDFDLCEFENTAVTAFNAYAGVMINPALTGSLDYYLRYLYNIGEVSVFRDLMFKNKPTCEKEVMYHPFDNEESSSLYLVMIIGISIAVVFSLGQKFVVWYYENKINLEGADYVKEEKGAGGLRNPDNANANANANDMNIKHEGNANNPITKDKDDTSTHSHSNSNNNFIENDNEIECNLDAYGSEDNLIKNNNNKKNKKKNVYLMDDTMEAEKMDLNKELNNLNNLNNNNLKEFEKNNKFETTDFDLDIDSKKQSSKKLNPNQDVMYKID